MSYFPKGPPVTKCRHGLRIREHWTECLDCVADNYPKAKTIDELSSIASRERLEDSIRRRESEERWKREEEKKEQERTKKLIRERIERKNRKQTIWDDLGFILAMSMLTVFSYLAIGVLGFILRLGTIEGSNRGFYYGLESFTNEAIYIPLILWLILLFPVALLDFNIAYREVRYGKVKTRTAVEFIVIIVLLIGCLSTLFFTGFFEKTWNYFIK